MGVLHLKIPFTGSLPSISVIVEHLSLLTEETVHYEEARWQISCPVMQEEFGLYPGDENQYILTTFEFNPTYLVDATLVVLQALGGTYTDSLSQWAKQPWHIAKRYY